MKTIYLLIFVLLVSPVFALQTEVESSRMSYVYFDLPESKFIDTYICDYEGSQCIAYLEFDLQGFSVNEAELILEIEHIDGALETGIVISGLKQPINEITWAEITENMDTYKRVKANVSEGINTIAITSLNLANGITIFTEDQNQVKRIISSSLRIDYEPVGLECELISAQWPKQSAVEGQTIQMRVNSNGCLGKQATIKVYENGLFLDQQIFEIGETIVNNEFDIDWIILFLEKLFDETNYYFIATVDDQSSRSGILNVKPVSDEVIESETPYERILEIKDVAHENEFLATKFCNEFESEHTRDMCLKRVGEEIARPSYCRKIKSDVKKDSCLLNIFFRKDKFVCDEISDTQLATNCYFIYLLQKSEENPDLLLDLDFEQEFQPKKYKFSFKMFIPLIILVVILLIVYSIKRGRKKG